MINNDKLIQKLRDYDKEDEFRRNAAKYTNLGLGRFFLVCEIDEDGKLKYTPVAYPAEGQTIIFEIYYEKDFNFLMEHDYYTHEVINLEIELLGE